MTIIIDDIGSLDSGVQKLLDFAGHKTKMMFTGEIGAGKTTFIQVFCQFFQVEEKVTSPTFSLINEYTYKDRKTGELQYIHHLDLYRLKSLEEAIQIGIEDYLYDEHYCLIEWPELIESVLPDDVVKINIEILENSSRKIIFL